MGNPILAFVESLVDEGLHPSSVAADCIDGIWQARVNCFDFCDDRESDGSRVNRDQVPPGIGVQGHVRWPDQTVLIAGNRGDMERWIGEVARVGGAPDWAIIGEGDNLTILTKPTKWQGIDRPGVVNAWRRLS